MTMTTDDDDMEELNYRAMDMEELRGGDDGSGDGDGSSNDIANEDGDARLDYDYEYYSPADVVLLGDQKSPSEEQRRRIERIERASSNVLEVMEKYGNASLPPLDPDNDVVRKHGWKIDEDSAWADPSAAMEEIVNTGEEMTNAWRDGGNGSGGDERGEDGEGGDSAHKKEWRKPIISNRSTNENHKVYSSKRGEWHHSGRAASSIKESPLTDEELNRFEAAHVEWATNAFAEELDALRTGRLESRTFAKNRKKNAGLAVALDPSQHSFVAVLQNKEGGGEELIAEEVVDVRVLADMIRSGSNFLSDTEKRMLLHARERATTARNPDGFNYSLSVQERRKWEIGFKQIDFRSGQA